MLVRRLETVLENMSKPMSVARDYNDLRATDQRAERIAHFFSFKTCHATIIVKLNAHEEERVNVTTSTLIALYSI